MIESNKSIPTVWALIDDKAGHKNQVLGVCEALGIPYIEKNVSYNILSKLPNSFKVKPSLLGVDKETMESVSSSFPDIVIAAGRKTAPIARHIKKQSGGKAFIVQLMWPAGNFKEFDLIAVPEHDNLPKSIRDLPNVISTVGAPHLVTEEILQKEGQDWKNILEEKTSSPRIALLVGGSTGKTSFTTSHAEDLARISSEIVDELKGSLLITTSRRTSAEIISAMKRIIKCESYFHAWHKGEKNPYYAFLALSDAIIVTGDSVSMCSEAAATGKPVYIFAPDEITTEKYKRTHKSFYESGYARKLSYETLSDIKQDLAGSLSRKTPLNVAAQVASRVAEVFDN